jgi:hypothetical protein
LRGDPSIFVIRPPRSVTLSVQASGQSSGHAVSTWDSGGATAGFGMVDYTDWIRVRRDEYPQITRITQI